MPESTAYDASRLTEAITDLRETVDRRLAEDPVREAAFDKLYAELKSYKDGFTDQAEKPLLLDLLLLHDSMNWFQQTLIKEEMSPETVADSFQFLIDELLEVLYRRDVVPMEAKDGFDPSLHRAVQLQKASGPDDDNRVAQVLKRGFLRHGKPLRPEEVVVYKWKGPAAASGRDGA
ncbi:MAG: nucleotide exchange factor GrpE [Alphaproteobacteria bacterium]|nr:nucleotide exchange factor GrpE [Alphaproteobacteria bacterium]